MAVASFGPTGVWHSLSIAGRPQEQRAVRDTSGAVVVFIGELVEHRRRSTPHSEAEVDGVHQIKSQRKGIDNDE